MQITTRMEFKVRGNVLTAFGEIENGTGAEFISVFSKLEQTQKEIIIKLHTTGGAVFDGNMIYNTIANSKTKVTIHIVGIAASMGAILSLAVEEVYMAENGFLMIHAPSSGAYGTANEIEDNVKLLRLIEANFLEKLQRKTGKRLEDLKAWLIGDNWFSAQQALQEGLIKGIINSEIEFKANFNPNSLTTNEAFNRFNQLVINKSKTKIFNKMDLREELIKQLGLKSGTSDTNILQEIEKATSLKARLIELLELDKNASGEDILGQVQTLLEQEQEAEEEKEAEAKFLIAEARRNGTLLAEQEPYIKDMFKKDFAGTKQFLARMPKRTPFSISTLIREANKGKEEANNKPKSEWDLDDYRKYAPKDLEQNPKLYKRLIKAKYNTNI